MAGRSSGEHSGTIIREGFLKHRETGFVNRVSFMTFCIVRCGKYNTGVTQKMNYYSL